ncbi:acyl-CoA dehydrogenase family protein [Cystobacter ferrugineus]|uniref:acyl-CoA dehydrogenase family protein n=1 Tax=Cystobacter ferrugineus TaxID=83449 RepID=UPI001FEC49E9|nr:acyl-CoA dehydrogenase family protein [Cystobacter ferrugineus]
MRLNTAASARHLEAAKRLTYHAVAVFDAKQNARREFSMAKLFSTETPGLRGDRTRSRGTLHREALDGRALGKIPDLREHLTEKRPVDIHVG